MDDLEDFYLVEERLRRFRDRESDLSTESSSAQPSPDDDRANLLEALRRLWAQGEASGAAIEGNFDAADIARRGVERLTATRPDD